MDSYITYGYGGSVLEPSHITGPLHKTVGTGAKPVRLATVAMANKTARIIWAVLTKNEPYTPQRTA